MAWKPLYANVEQFHDWLRLRDASDVEDDVTLRRHLSAASRAVDGSCKRQFGKNDTPVTRYHEVRWSRSKGAYVALITDIMDTTGLTFTLDGVELTADQYSLRNRNALADGMPYTWVVLSDVTVTGDGVLAGEGLWGWNAPFRDEVVEATLLQASRLSVRPQSPYGIAGGSDSGTELRLLSRLDPDIAPLVTDLVHTGWVAK